MPEPSLRYWVYTRERIVGPYEPEAVRRLPVFAPDLPLCAEELLGAAEERWARAADAPDFARDFPPEARTPAGAEPAKVGPWPPDAERSAVDLVSSAQQRMELIDRSLESTQRRLELRREGYERLKRELAARAASAKELHEKLLSIGTRLGGFLGMKQTFDQARAALIMQNERVAELEARLQRLADSAPPPEAGALRDKRVAELEAKLGALMESVAPPEDAARRDQSIAELQRQLKRVEEEVARESERRQAAAPAEPAVPPARKPRPKEDALGLPPPTTLDVPDFQ